MVAPVPQAERYRGPPPAGQKTALPTGEGCPFTLQSVWGLGPSLQFTGRCAPLTIATSGTLQVWRRRRGGFLPGYRNRDLHRDGRERLQFARRRAGKACDCPFVEPEGSRETLEIG